MSLFFITLTSLQVYGQSVNVKLWVVQRPALNDPSVLWPSDQNIENMINEVENQFLEDGIGMDICYEMITDDFLLYNQEEFLRSTCYETPNSIDGFIYPQTTGQTAPGAGQACLPTNWPCPAGRFYSLNFSNTVVHELGHVLGLRHTFLGSSSCYEPSTSINGDNIEDTPYHPTPTSLFDNPFAWLSNNIYSELLNPGFEDGLNSWQTAGAVNTSGFVNSGSQAIRIFSNGGIASQILTIPNPNENYILTVACATNGADNTVVGIEYYNAQNNLIASFESPPINTSTTSGTVEYQNITLFAQAPQAAITMKVYLEKEAGQSTANFDDLMLSSISSSSECSMVSEVS